MRVPRLRLPIPAKLLLVSSLLLLIPWLGLRYVHELERLLLEAQEQGLVAVARAVATALHDRPNVLLSGEVYSVPFGPERDLRVGNLDTPIVVDGETADWDRLGVESRTFTAGPDRSDAPPFSFGYRVGRHGTGVYTLFEVQDDHVVLRDPERPDLAANDHIQIAVVTADDDFLRFALDARGDGPVSVWLMPDVGPRVRDNRLSGVWLGTDEGYRVELRLPRTLIGPRLSFGVVDVDDPETRTLVGQLSTGGTAVREQLGTVLVPSPEISEIIRGLGRGQSRIWVVDVNRRVLAHAGRLQSDSAPGLPSAESHTAWDRAVEAWVHPVFRHLLSEPSERFQDVEAGTYRLEGPEVERALGGQPGTRWRLTPDSRAVVLSATHPVWIDDEVRGVVLVEETTNDILAVRNRAFEKIFAALLAACLLGTLALLTFASRLSWRIRRLRDQVEGAIDRQGRVTKGIPGSAINDEMGDLTRSFADILDKQRQYTVYLEQIGSRLSHEIRTPVGVVRSSLDNLRLEPLPEGARVYMERADDGLRRLATILSRMSEATRLEQMLAATDRERFDLGPVVRGSVEGYRLANSEREILLRQPQEPLWVRGAPDLLAQLLDKLVENALSFAKPETAVRVELDRVDRRAILTVLNDGPSLPEQMQRRLFESMVSIRSASAGAGPHLGLGLFIVRLIAGFHGGEAMARNREDATGVAVSVAMPLLANEEADATDAG